jgi:peptidoglycan/xylan/chitin deacetylase (PgdA/CDA1 family)
MKKLPFVLSIILIPLLLAACNQAPNTAKDYGGCLIWHGDLSGKNIYLTFDDGPSSEATTQILDILKEHNVKATFFVLGKKAKKHPEIIKRIHAEGHDIGNHTFKHVGGQNVTGEIAEKEISNTDKAVKAACGVSPKFFRPPFGFFNYRYFAVAEQLGYKSILWTIDVGDWNKISSTEIEARLVPKVKGGYIILLHDGGENREPLIDALPVIIEKLKAKGFKFEKLSKI